MEMVVARPPVEPLNEVCYRILLALRNKKAVRRNGTIPEMSDCFNYLQYVYASIRCYSSDIASRDPVMIHGAGSAVNVLLLFILDTAT